MLPDNTPIKEYTGNGVTVAFSFPYKFFDATHVTVYRKVISTGIVTTVDPSEYTVSGAGAEEGGTFSFLIPPTSDHFITLLLDAVPLSQEADYVAGEGFPADAHEAQQDKVIMIMQQMREELKRCPQVDPGSGIEGAEYLTTIEQAVTDCESAQTAAELAEGGAQTAQGLAESARDEAQSSAASAAVSAATVNLPVIGSGDASKLLQVKSDETGYQHAAAAAIWALVGPLAYPVGKVVTLGVATNPATLWGFGTWTAIAGRVIVGIDATQTEFDTLNETGGEKTHTLTVPEVPALTVTAAADRWGADGVNPGSNFYASSGNVGYGVRPTMTTTGGGGAHNNLQPYIVKYVWQRTA